MFFSALRLCEFLLCFGLSFIENRICDHGIEEIHPYIFQLRKKALITISMLFFLKNRVETLLHSFQHFIVCFADDGT